MRKQTQYGEWITSRCHDLRGPISPTDKRLQCSRCGKVSDFGPEEERCVLHFEFATSGYFEED